MYIVSFALHGQVELQFDSQMDPSLALRGISSTTQLQVVLHKPSKESHYLHIKGGKFRICFNS
jgi:hypothetical protein